MHPNELMQLGVLLVGFKYDATKVCHDTWVSRFVAFYGSKPVVYTKLMLDLQASINDFSPTKFLMSLHFLRRFPSETEQAAMFSICEKTARKWTWFYIEKIAQLKETKVCVAVKYNFFIHYVITLTLYHLRLSFHLQTVKKYSLHPLTGFIAGWRSQGTRRSPLIKRTIPINLTQPVSLMKLPYPCGATGAYG